MAIFSYLGYFQNGGISTIFANIHRQNAETTVIANLELLEENWYNFKITIVYEGLQHDCNEKSVAPLVKDLDGWWRHNLKIDEWYQFETDPDINKFPPQIYRKLPKVPSISVIQKEMW